MAKALVIVESPTKARTISRFLGPDYEVESSLGHVRDLPESAKEIPEAVKKEPWARLGIDVDHGFKPLYVVPAKKEDHLKVLRKKLAGADLLYLATDEDREGEAISWHLLELLKPKVPVKRLVFHEITRQAIDRALENTRQIDQGLVAAQETRRVLDRLYGYEISPLLWRKIAPALSAGRVQSVAVRIMVVRERERMAFHAASYWGVEAALLEGGHPFAAQLTQLDGKKLCKGDDFDPATGQLRAAKAGGVAQLDEAEAQALAQALSGVALTVARLEEKPFTAHPAAPFITSTLQQEASRKLGLSPQETMRVAQSLYEQGYITYMRTDSTSLSEQAITAARGQIEKLYGQENLPAQPRAYKSKVKNAQEAHEAIRPAGEAFKLPEALKGELNPAEWRLYELIWKRTIASQMADTRGRRTNATLAGQAAGRQAQFAAQGKTIDFPGFLRAYVEGSDDPEASLEDKEVVLPPLQEGQVLKAQGYQPTGHTTKPPARYTEASLIKELEKEGIGRPSTYASIIATILRREYVEKRKGQLVPSFTAFAVVRLMEEYFSMLVDNNFTAQMEDTLDAIAAGQQQPQPYLEAFYHGSPNHPGLAQLVLSEIDPRQACTIPLYPDQGQGEVNVRVGKFGPYLERGEKRASIPHNTSPDELSPELVERLLEKSGQPDVLGVDPASGKEVLLKEGRFGPYVQLGAAEEGGPKPRMKSLLPGQTLETLTLDEALALLSLPRSLGVDEAAGEEVVVDLGRYGPYAIRGKETRSLPSHEALFSLTLAEAQALFAQPKAVRRGAALLRALGKDEATGKEINVMSGRFGPYATDGELNASLPRGASPESITLEEAMALLAKKAAQGPAPARGRKKAAPKAAAAKKTAPKKSPAKAATAKKAGAKKNEAKKNEAKKAGAKKSPAKAAAAKKPAKPSAAPETAPPPKKPTLRKSGAAKARP